jgi:NAD(P)-dependent dehydrogenase (short-subunit alcohol dehydrogenase family)
MEIKDKIVVITGAASGIGAALAQAYAHEQAGAVVIADRDFAKAQTVAAQLTERYPTVKFLAVDCDVSRAAHIQKLVKTATSKFGAIDIYISNAGILGKPGGLELDDSLWQAMWYVHGMAHIWAARAVMPSMVERGAGFFLVTASAAGLLSIVESAPYAVTKHAALASAEWLRIAYGRQGVQVSCLCPQSVDTPMVAELDASGGSAGLDGVASPEQVAQDVIKVMQSGEFLVLPHPQVAQYFKLKANDYDRWLGGMQKLYSKHSATNNQP